MSQYKHYDGKKNCYTKYMKQNDYENITEISACMSDCFCKYIKPRSKYDQMMAQTVALGKPFQIPEKENFNK